jgi:hypothetical protein
MGNDDASKKSIIYTDSDVNFVNIEEGYTPSEKSVKTLHKTDSKIKTTLLLIG